MRFYNTQHAFYCGIDLHARSMFTHILDQAGKTVFERDLPAGPDAFLEACSPFRQGLVVGCECMFAWYWLADLCEDHDIPFVLGHALYMKASHGGKAKNERIDAGKIAGLLRGGMFPLAYVYPRAKRETRDLRRRRCHFVNQRSQLTAPIVNTNSQYNLPPLTAKLCYAGNRSDDLAERFQHASTRQSILADLRLIDAYDEQIDEAGTKKGSGGKKIGNAHLKWAFSEAACLMLRAMPEAKKWLQRQERKRGKRKALAVLEAKIGRTVYHLMRKQQPFDAQRFFSS